MFFRFFVFVFPLLCGPSRYEGVWLIAAVKDAGWDAAFQLWVAFVDWLTALEVTVIAVFALPLLNPALAVVANDGCDAGL